MAAPGRMRKWKAAKRLRRNFFMCQTDGQFADKPGVTVKNHGPATEDVKLRLLLQSINLPREPIRKADIVRVHAGDESPTAQRHGLIEPRRQPGAGWFANQPDARIVECTDDRCALICGAII